MRGNPSSSPAYPSPAAVRASTPLRVRPCALQAWAMLRIVARAPGSGRPYSLLEKVYFVVTRHTSHIFFGRSCKEYMVTNPSHTKNCPGINVQSENCKTAGFFCTPGQNYFLQTRTTDDNS